MYYICGKYHIEMENREEIEKNFGEMTPDEQIYYVTNKAVEALKTVFDPEIPVNIYDLGLIYKIDYVPEDKTLHVDMTLTAPSCPAADFLVEDARMKLAAVEGPEKLDLHLVFEPEWDKEMMSEEAKLELGFL